MKIVQGSTSSASGAAQPLGSAALVRLLRRYVHEDADEVSAAAREVTERANEIRRMGLQPDSRRIDLHAGVAAVVRFFVALQRLNAETLLLRAAESEWPGRRHVAAIIYSLPTIDDVLLVLDMDGDEAARALMEPWFADHVALVDQDFTPSPGILHTLRTIAATPKVRR